MDKESKQMFELILAKLDNMEKRQESMEESLRSVDKTLKNVEKRQDNMEKRQDSMEKRQDEIFQVVKAIEHSNNIHKAEIDNIQYKVAHTEGVINKVADVIVESRAIK